MNQEKIGKFIQEKRKAKNLTQADLAYKLGVSDRTIGNWENGRNMPDLSLFKPLCHELDISINEFISGEKIDDDSYQERFEENVIKAIDYTTRKSFGINNIIGLILIVFGLLITLAAMSIFASSSSWASIYGLIGAVISTVGIFRLLRFKSLFVRIAFDIGYFVCFVLLLFLIDYLGVILIKQAPRFSYLIETGGDMIVYKTPFYNVYRINYDTENEYYIVDTEKKYTDESVPNVPFNRNHSGIDNIIKYKNKYVGNNSNDGNLLNFLPLSEYGFVFKIDSKNLGLLINYHITDWYINENQYLKKSLIYNTISIFTLIENVCYIEYSFSGNSYKISRDDVINNYPNFKDITFGVNDIDSFKSNFNKYLEAKISDSDFIDDIFSKLFN